MFNMQIRKPVRFSRATRWGTHFCNAAIFFGLVWLTGLKMVAYTDIKGMVGTIGEFAADTDLGCGERYYPYRSGIVMAGVPCGTLVEAFNPSNGAVVVTKVIGNRPVFRKGQGHSGDMSVGTTRSLGLNSESEERHAVILRVLHGEWAGVRQNLFPFAADMTPALAVLPLPYSGSDLHALTLNMLGECLMCGRPGMVAVAQVTRNRLDQRFNSKKDLYSVVYDRNQFSWTRPEMGKPVSKGTIYANARTLAEKFLNGNLSGKLLAVQYLVGLDANHYYAPDVIATPSWGGRKNRKLITVRMENHKEIELFHRFYEYREANPIGSMLAKY